MELKRRLVAIGGAEDRTGARVILREVLRLAGGAQARVVVVPTASRQPRDVGSAYAEVFRELGAQDATCVMLLERDDATDPGLLAPVEEATCVFFTGGDQLRAVNTLGGTPFDTILQRRMADGVLIAGTSAGASMMSSTMIVGGDPDERPRANYVRTGPGMGLVQGVIIDQHFAKRGRLGRLISVIAKFPHNLGVGIDENTALFIDGEECAVVGDNAVTIIDAGQTSFNDALEAEDGACLGLGDITLHLLPDGYGFNLRKRRPRRPSEEAATEALQEAS